MAVIIGIVLLCVASLSQQEPCDQPQVTEGRQLHPKLLGYAAEELNSSFIISGYSLIDPLKMLRLAAKGYTLADLNDVLSPLSEDHDVTSHEVDCHPAYGSGEGAAYRKASKLYLEDDYKVNPSYANDIKAKIDSEVQNIDFSNKVAAANEINDWVKLNTDNLIDGIVSEDDLTPDTVAIIVNALYFSGRWQKEFDEDLTKLDDFYVSDGVKVIVPFMTQEDFFLLGNSDNLHASVLELPFLGSKSKMKVVVPHNPNDANALPELLKLIADGVNLTDLSSNEVEYLSLSLPKFQIETSLVLNDFLESLGLDIFSDQTQLPYMVEEKLNVLISKVKQKSFIEVSESGVKAAAVNEVAVIAGAALEPEPLEFKLDHPFYFEIDYLDKVLFSGVFRG